MTIAQHSPVVHLTRRYWFSASHRLHHPALAEAQNRELYGKCNNPGGHGHNYYVELTVAGPVNPRTGMVVHLGELDELVKAQILEPFGESYLNERPNFQNVVPTTENLCLEIYRIVKQGWRQLPSAPQATLERVRLEETRSNFFEYRGDDAGTGLPSSPM